METSNSLMELVEVDMLVVHRKDKKVHRLVLRRKDIWQCHMVKDMVVVYKVMRKWFIGEMKVHMLVHLEVLVMVEDMIVVYRRHVLEDRKDMMVLHMKLHRVDTYKKDAVDVTKGTVVYMNDIVAVMEDMIKVIPVAKGDEKRIILLLVMIFKLVRIVILIVRTNLSQFSLGARIETDGIIRKISLV